MNVKLEKTSDVNGEIVVSEVEDDYAHSVKEEINLVD